MSIQKSLDRISELAFSLETERLKIEAYIDSQEEKLQAFKSMMKKQEVCCDIQTNQRES